MEKPVLKLTSPLPESVNHYTCTRTIIKNGKPIPIVYKTDKARKYEEEFKKIIQEEAKKQNWNIEVNDTQHFYTDAVFYFDRTDRDVGNYEKQLCDTITHTQLVWKDDNVNMFRPKRIYYDKNNPRIELEIYPVDYIGIFDNKLVLEMFEKKCKTCSRYKRNCSILKKAIEGRIQEEIDEDLVCSKYKQTKNKN